MEAAKHFRNSFYLLRGLYFR